MTLLNDTIADIYLEVDTLSELLDTVLKLKEKAEEREDRYSNEDYEELMWNYKNTIDGIKTAIRELNDAGDSLVKC